MPRLLVVGMLVVGAVVAQPGSADATGTTSCEVAVRTFVAAHTWAYEQAGSPPVVCETSASGSLAGLFDGTTVHVYPHRGSAPEDVYMRETVAHEVGHAFAARAIGGRRWITYARLRGFPISTDPAAFLATLATMREDYAETWAFALDDWAALGSAPPFAFQTVAGTPTPQQLHDLSCARLLPIPRLCPRSHR